MRRRFFNRPRRRGIAVLLTAVFLVVLVPLMGLSIDAGVLYAVHAKLSAACDAAALAGGRALSRGADATTQKTNAQTIAAQYVALNFPNGYFGTSGATVPTPPVDDTSVPHQRSITVTASVAVPTYFMRWLGVNSVTVNSSAQAVRRDVNVAIAMDRSGSLQLTGSCAPLKAAAENFVNQFAVGRDNLALVTFATASQADFPISSNFGSVSTTINSITCSGGTSTALGLYNAYHQLASLNQPTALNVILLFTDGQPTNITAAFPKAGGSTCVNTTGTLVTTFTVPNPSDPSTWYPSGMQGLYTMAPPDATMISPHTNCHYTATTDLAYIPSTDIYGTNLDSGYQSLTKSGSQITLNYTNLDNASVNEADSAALRIRHGNTINGDTLSGVVMFSIGLGNAGGVSDDLLERIANDSRASNYEGASSGYPTGLYILASDTESLNDAFLQIASEILRLAK